MNKPEINFSLFVDKGLKYEVWYWGKQIKKHSVEIDEVPLPSELKKLLSYLTQISSNESNELQVQNGQQNIISY